MSAAKTSKKKSNPLVPRMMIDGFERDIQESYIRERAPEILETLLIDRTMTAADFEGRVHRIRWCTDDYGFAADAEIDPELISKPDVKIIRPRVDKRPTFDEHGRKVGQKNAEVGAKRAEVGAEPITNRSEPITNGIPDLPADFDSRMASNRKDLRERAKRIWLRIARDADVTVRDLAQECGFGLASTQGALNALRETGLLSKTGVSRNGQWYVIVPAQRISKKISVVGAKGKKGKEAK